MTSEGRVASCPRCDGHGWINGLGVDAGEARCPDCRGSGQAGRLFSPKTGCRVCRHTDHGTEPCDHRMPSWGLMRCVCRGPEEERSASRLPSGEWRCILDNRTEPCGECSGCREVQAENAGRSASRSTGGTS